MSSRQGNIMLCFFIHRISAHLKFAGIRKIRIMHFEVFAAK